MFVDSKGFGIANIWSLLLVCMLEAVRLGYGAMVTIMIHVISTCTTIDLNFVSFDRVGSTASTSELLYHYLNQSTSAIV